MMAKPIPIQTRFNRPWCWTQGHDYSDGIALWSQRCDHCGKAKANWTLLLVGLVVSVIGMTVVSQLRNLYKWIRS